MICHTISSDAMVAVGMRETCLARCFQDVCFKRAVMRQRIEQLGMFDQFRCWKLKRHGDIVLVKQRDCCLLFR
jgi:hypothetical protein